MLIFYSLSEINEHCFRGSWHKFINNVPQWLSEISYKMMETNLFSNTVTLSPRPRVWAVLRIPACSLIRENKWNLTLPVLSRLDYKQGIQLNYDRWLIIKEISLIKHRQHMVTWPFTAGRPNLQGLQGCFYFPTVDKWGISLYIDLSIN